MILSILFVSQRWDWKRRAGELCWRAKEAIKRTSKEMAREGKDKRIEQTYSLAFFDSGGK